MGVAVGGLLSFTNARELLHGTPTGVAQNGRSPQGEADVRRALPPARGALVFEPAPSTPRTRSSRPTIRCTRPGPVAAMAEMGVLTLAARPRTKGGVAEEDARCTTRR